MSLTPLDPRGYGSPLSVRARLLRLLPVVIALLLGCAKAGTRPAAPLEDLHYPAWLGTTSAPGYQSKLFAVSLDQDLAFNNGAVVTLDATASAAPVLPDDGLSVPNMAGRLLLVDGNTGAGCTKGPDFEQTLSPFALVAGRTEDVLVKFPLTAPTTEDPHPLGTVAKERINVGAPSSSTPFGVGLSCSPDGTPRAWTSHLRGRDGFGYVAQVDLSTTPPQKVIVQILKGNPRNFAYDRDHDRLYITTQERNGKAPIRWISVGQGCKRFDGGIQDERLGGCHVDPGFDLSAQLAGAEPNEIALSSGSSECTLGPYAGQSCRRMYLTVRLYDADQEKATGERPSKDIGGLLVVLELPESSLGAPDPQWVRAVSLGVTAGPLLVIPRPGHRDLVVAAAVEDDVVMLYDDEVGAVVDVFTRDPNTGIPALGHYLAGLAARDMGSGTTRVFVSSYHDHWVSAIDVTPGPPASAHIVMDANASTPTALHLGNQP